MKLSLYTTWDLQGPMLCICTVVLILLALNSYCATQLYPQFLHVSRMMMSDIFALMMVSSSRVWLHYEILALKLCRAFHSS